MPQQLHLYTLRLMFILNTGAYQRMVVASMLYLISILGTAPATHDVLLTRMQLAARRL
jgi:hypothetical protein